MLEFLLKIVPVSYRWSIIGKKIAWLIGKIGVGYLTGMMVNKGHLTPDQANTIQVTVTGAVASGIEMLHDFLKLKYGETKWGEKIL